MPAYYNEFDPGAAAWLRELIKKGLIADGYVDERSILDVRPSELSEFTQCHFFGGIGGWSLALRLARWPDDRPVWTGSPPCQPFSSAGRQLGKDDSRHLAPHFIDLVRACRPRVLFGEQVASSDVFGKAAKRARGKPTSPPQWAWIDDLSDRLEAARYAVGAVDFPSAGIGAPHTRQRTFFGAVDLDGLADASSQSGERNAGSVLGEEDKKRRTRELNGYQPDGYKHGGTDGGLADCDKHGCGSPAIRGFRDSEHNAEPCCYSFGVGDAHGSRGKARIPEPPQWHERQSEILDHGMRGLPGPVAGRSQPCGLADSGCRLLQSGKRSDNNTSAPRQVEGEARKFERGGIGDSHGCADDRMVRGDAARPGSLHSFWSDADWLFCRDGKWRPVEPGTFPLAHGVSGRVGLLRGYGNAINPWAAKEFIEAFSEVIDV